MHGTGHAPAHDGDLVWVAVDEPEQLRLLLATGGGEAQSWKPDESKSGRRWVVTVPQDAEQSILDDISSQHSDISASFVIFAVLVLRYCSSRPYKMLLTVKFFSLIFDNDHNS